MELKLESKDIKRVKDAIEQRIDYLKELDVIAFDEQIASLEKILEQLHGGK